MHPITKAGFTIAAIIFGLISAYTWAGIQWY